MLSDGIFLPILRNICINVPLSDRRKVKDHARDYVTSLLRCGYMFDAFLGTRNEVEFKNLEESQKEND
jgi:hypothetical protein